MAGNDRHFSVTDLLPRTYIAGQTDLKPFIKLGHTKLVICPSGLSMYEPCSSGSVTWESASVSLHVMHYESFKISFSFLIANALHWG